MDVALSSLLAARAGALGAGLEAALLASDAPHYREALPEERRARLERLVAAFLEAVRAGGPAPFVAHVRAIAGERAEEGYFLREIQLRSRRSRRRPGRWSRAPAGTRTSSCGGWPSSPASWAGARTSWRERSSSTQERAEARVASLEQRLAELFKGTQSPPEGEG